MILPPVDDAAFTTPTLTVGLHVIEAVYLGADGFEGSISARTFELVQTS